MPEMTGFELAEQIKQHPELARATVMMLSAADRPTTARTGATWDWPRT